MRYSVSQNGKSRLGPALVLAVFVAVSTLAAADAEEMASTAFTVEAMNMELPHEQALALEVLGAATPVEPARGYGRNVDLAVGMAAGVCGTCTVRLTGDGATIASFSFEPEIDRLRVWNLFLAEDVVVDPDVAIFRGAYGLMDGRVEIVAVTKEPLDAPGTFFIDLDNRGGFEAHEAVVVPEVATWHGRHVHAAVVDVVGALPVVTWSADLGGIPASGSIMFLENTVTSEGNVDAEHVTVLYVGARSQSLVRVAELLSSVFRPVAQLRWSDASGSAEMKYSLLGVEHFDDELFDYMPSQPVRVGHEQASTGEAELMSTPTSEGGALADDGHQEPSDMVIEPAPEGRQVPWLLPLAGLVAVAAGAGALAVARRGPRIRGALVRDGRREDLTGKRKFRIEHVDADHDAWVVDVRGPGRGARYAGARMRIDGPGPALVNGMMVEPGESFMVEDGSVVEAGGARFMWDDPERAAGAVVSDGGEQA